MATTFVDGTTPLNAAAMNGIEDEIADVSDSVDTIGNRSFNMARSGRTSIPSGSDLNDYSTVGSYYASSNSVATSLENCPCSIAFGMWTIETDGTGFLVQIIIARTGVIYNRYYNTSSGWTSWYQINRTAV